MSLGGKSRFPSRKRGRRPLLFAAADDDGKMASLFYMMPAPGKEGMLAGILNVHAMLFGGKEKGVHELIPEIPSDAGISAVILLHAGAGDTSRECRMLAIKLGISILRLYHGIYAVPIKLIPCNRRTVYKGRPPLNDRKGQQ